MYNSDHSEVESRAVVATAHHEAGHAVAHWMLDLPIASLTIVADEITLGRCVGEGFPDWFQPDVEVDDRHRLLAEAHIVATLAGAAAERHYLELSAHAS